RRPAGRKQMPEKLEKVSNSFTTENTPNEMVRPQQCRSLKDCLRCQQGQQSNHGGEDRHEGGVLDNNISARSSSRLSRLRKG
ncbi:hypothetical protein V3C99_010119, partial [Haemonchus contortus]